MFIIFIGMVKLMKASTGLGNRQICEQFKSAGFWQESMTFESDDKPLGHSDNLYASFTYISAHGICAHDSFERRITS